MNYINKLIKTILILCLLSSVMHAAPNGVYLELGLGIGTKNIMQTTTATYTYNRSPIGSVAFGYQVNNLRFELEGLYKEDPLASVLIGENSHLKVDGNLITNSKLVNFYYSGYNHSKLITSIGVGGGITSLSLQNTIKDDAILTMNAMFSVGYQVSENLIINTKYRYLYTDESENFKAKGDNIISLGLCYIF